MTGRSRLIGEPKSKTKEWTQWEVCRTANEREWVNRLLTAWGKQVFNEQRKTERGGNLNLWMCLIPPIAPLDRLCSQIAANSRWMEKESGILRETFTHLVVPCCIPLTHPSRVHRKGMLQSLIPLLHALLGGRTLSRLSLSVDLPEGRDCETVKLGHTAVKAKPF